MFLMFTLRRPDVLPVGDLGIRRAIKERYGLDSLPSPAEMERASRILEAAQGAARFEGELVDEASRRLAEALLRRAKVLG